MLFAKENKLIKKGDKILLGISGGVDSVVLLDLFLKHKDKLKINILLAHVNYGLRKESDNDNQFVVDLAKKYDLPLFEKKVELHGGNFEEKARDIRYLFFNEVIAAKKLDKIAVAHQKNDLAETMLLNLVRGTGIDGLASMRVRSDNLVRPLLFASRKEVEAYARKNKISFVSDKTNEDIAIKRNFIRHKLIPELEKNNPGFIQTMAQENRVFQAIADSQNKMASKIFARIAKSRHQVAEIPLKELSKFDPYLRSLIFRKAIKEVKGSLRDISAKNIFDLEKLSQKTSGTKEIHLPSGLKASRIYDKIIIEKGQKSLLKTPQKAKLEFGEKVNFGKWQIKLAKAEKFSLISDISLVQIDIQKAGKLLVRSRLDGDRIAISASKSKKIQDIFTDAKVPKSARDSYPVIVNRENEVVWIPKLRLSDNFKANSKTKNIVVIESKES